MRRALVWGAIGCWALIGGVGCGYHLQTSRTQIVEHEQIRRVFIAAVANNSLRPGLENIVHSALTRALGSFGGIRVVSNREDADGYLVASINSMTSTSSAATSFRSLAQTTTVNSYDASSFTTEYSASMDCSFRLERAISVLSQVAGKRKVVWSGTFSRTKPYPAHLQVDVPGTTSQLIADAELDRTLTELASQMVVDVRESMLAQF